MVLITPTANITPGGLILAADELTVYNAINGNLDGTNITPGSLTGAVFSAGSISLTKLKQSSSSVGVQQVAAKHFGGAYITLPSSTMFFPALSTDAGAGTIASLGGWRIGTGGAAGTIGGGAGTITMAGPGSLGDNSTDFNYAGGVNAAGVDSGGAGFARVAANQTPQYIIWLAVMNATNVGTNQGFMTAFYLQASPPYDLGDGEIPLFVFALVGKDGSICATFVGTDPPWATHPGKSLKLPFTHEEAASDPAKMDQYVQALDAHIDNKKGLNDLAVRFAKEPTIDGRRDIANAITNLDASIWTGDPGTQEHKNRLMHKVPHPFVANDLELGGAFESVAPLTVVMLDPTDKNINRLALMHESGENVNALIHNGHVTFGNEHIAKRSGPPGVKIVKHSFKNSGGK